MVKKDKTKIKKETKDKSKYKEVFNFDSKDKDFKKVLDSFIKVDKAEVKKKH